MKDIFSAFGSEVFRPLVTLVLPGAIGLSAWFVVLLQKCPAVKMAVQAKPREAYVILALVAVALGMIKGRIRSLYAKGGDVPWIDTRVAHADCDTTYLGKYILLDRHA